MGVGGVVGGWECKNGLYLVLDKFSQIFFQKIKLCFSNIKIFKLKFFKKFSIFLTIFHQIFFYYKPVYFPAHERDYYSNIEFRMFNT